MYDSHYNFVKKNFDADLLFTDTDSLTHEISKKHKLGTYEINKISLSCFDDKRYVLDDGICTLAYFHKDSVTSWKDIEKDCDKENHDNWKRL